jgi:iron complex outermembrane recepter protein
LLPAICVCGVDVRSESKPTHDRTTFWQVALNGRTALSDTLEMTGLAGWSRSEFDSHWERVYLESNDHTVSFAGLDTDNPTNSYDFDVANPSQWDLMSIQWRQNHIESEYYNAGLGLDWEASESSTFKAGGSYKRFTNSAYQYNASTNYKNSGALDTVPTLVNEYASAIRFVVADVPASFEALGNDASLDASNLSTGTDYFVKEETFAGYVQYDLNTQLGEIGLRANLCVRYYSTRLTSSGSSVTDSGFVPVRIISRYDGFLPALNIAFDLDRSLVLRLNANRNISRPALSDLSAAATVRVAGYGGTISAGNPYLTPYSADSVEASLEYYDGTRGFLSAGVFFKKMKSFVTTETSTVPYGETGYPLNLLEDGLDASTVFNFTRPVNTPGASIKGVEVAAKRDFDFLPAPLDKLGALANLTYADGHTDVYYDDVPYDLTLVDLSKWSYNATLYYDTPVFGARVSAAYRSRYRKGTGGNGNIGGYFTPTTFVDATAYYNITERLQVRVEGLNLTDERLVQYADTDARRMMTNTVSGRTISLGASYRF